MLRVNDLHMYLTNHVIYHMCSMLYKFKNIEDLYFYISANKIIKIYKIDIILNEYYVFLFIYKFFVQVYLDII